MRDVLRSAAARAALLRPHVRACASALALACSVAAGASAQTTTPTTTQSSNQAIDANFVVRRNTKIVPNGTLVFADIADCGGDDFPKTGPASTFEFSATYTTNVPVVELWLGVGSSENCATQANRLPSGGNSALPPACTYLGSDTTNTRNPKITVPGNRLFNQTTGAWFPGDNRTEGALKGKCDSLNGGQTYTIYFLPLQTPTTNVNGSDPIMVGNLSTLRAVFTPYTQRPAAPASLTGQSGESELGVSFKAPASSMTLTEYRAYFDVTDGMGGGTAPAPAITDAGMDGGLDAGLPSPATIDAATPDDEPNETEDDDDDAVDAGSAVAACGTGYLVGGRVAPPNPPPGDVKRSSASNNTTLKLAGLGDVPVGRNVAVSVVSIDPAGNESLLANPICVKRVNTTGFIDACNNVPGCKSELTSCSLGPATAEGAWSFAGLSLALAALIRRRRRA